MISSLASEHRLIVDAERALLEHQPGRALQYLAEHRRDFRGGGSAELRDMLRIRAHCARDNIPRARAVAEERASDPQFAALAHNPCR